MSNQGTDCFLDILICAADTLKEDAGFLIRLTEKAESESVFEALPYSANKGIVLPWLKQFAMLVRQITTESER